MATITVRGEATVRTEPDAATLSLVVTALEPDAPAALADVTARAAELSRLLDEMGVAAGDRTTTGVTVHEEFDYTGRGRRSLGHRATAGVSVRMEDATHAGRLIEEATNRADARVGGPQWHVDADNPAYLEAARRAAEDARRRAQAYADGIGARLGAVERMEEPPERHHPRFVALAAASAERDDLPVDPGTHGVSAAVLVTFALETP